MIRALLSLALLAVAAPGCEGCESSPRTSAGAGTGGVLQGTSSLPGSGEAGATGGDPRGQTGPDDNTAGTGPTSSSTTGGSSTGFLPALPDLPPFPEACLEPSPTLAVERAQGPEGALNFDQAYLVTDYCSSGPVLHIRDSTAGITLLCILDAPQPLQGVLDCAPFSGNPSEFTAELLEPYDDPDPDTATSGVHLHARLMAAGDGWDVSVLVDVPDCGDRDCFCPCE